MTSEEQSAMWNTPLSHEERESAAEVFDQYEGLDRVAAWRALRNRAFETARPFRAYDCAHAVAAAQVQARLRKIDKI
jgi:hypothetical protein